MKSNVIKNITKLYVFLARCKINIKLTKWSLIPPLFHHIPRYLNTDYEEWSYFWSELIRPNYMLRGKIKLPKWSFKPPFFSPNHPPRIPDTSTRTTESYGW